MTDVRQAEIGFAVVVVVIEIVRLFRRIGKGPRGCGGDFALVGEPEVAVFAVTVFHQPAAVPRNLSGLEKTAVDPVIPADQRNCMGNPVCNRIVVIVELGSAVVVTGSGNRAVFGNGSFQLRNPLVSGQVRGDQIRAFKAVECIFRNIRGRFVACNRPLPHTQQGRGLPDLTCAGQPFARIK